MIRSVLLIILTSFFFLVSDTFSSEFDHEYSDYQNRISKYISVRDGLVDYRQLKIHSKGVDNFIESSSEVKPEEYEKWSDNQKLAYLINLYNVSTIKLILDNYPLKSIKDIEKPWDREFVNYPGSKISLNTLEHKIIRKEFNDPRIHFALVCAARGCPVLRTEPFTASKLESQLEEAKRMFFSTRFKNYLDISSNTLHLSPLFKWYSEDFANKSGSVKKYVIPNLTDRELTSKQIENLKIVYTDYDWTLNDIRAKYN